MKLGLSLLLFTCASHATTMESREPTTHARVQLDLAAPADERAVFPQLEEPRLPSVDRIAHQVRAQLGDEVIAAIELCVAADGHVTKVALLESTSSEAVDNAVLRDIEDWKFSAMPGASVATLQTCERAKVRYLAPR